MINFEEHVDKLYKLAKKILKKDGWTLHILYWEDNTFTLDYRHGDNDGMHCFYYAPHDNENLVRHYLVNYNEQIYAKFWNDSDYNRIIFHEEINIVTEERVLKYNCFDLIKDTGKVIDRIKIGYYNKNNDPDFYNDLFTELNLDLDGNNSIHAKIMNLIVGYGESYLDKYYYSKELIELANDIEKIALH